MKQFWTKRGITKYLKEVAMKQNILIAVSTLLVILGLVTPTFASTNGDGPKHNHHQNQVQNSTCFKEARTTFVQAVHQANVNYKNARQAARQELKTNLSNATTEDQRVAARTTYRNALKTALKARQSALKAAMTEVKTAKANCS
jgi:hypothetical protein